MADGVFTGNKGTLTVQRFTSGTEGSGEGFYTVTPSQPAVMVFAYDCILLPGESSSFNVNGNSRGRGSLSADGITIKLGSSNNNLVYTPTCVVVYK